METDENLNNNDREEIHNGDEISVEKDEVDNSVVMDMDENPTVVMKEDPHKPKREEDSLVGTVFADKYEVLELIGFGGMSNVYKVKHIKLDTIQALKVLHKHLWSDPLAVERFRFEAKSINELNHKNLINYLDYGVSDGQPYLSMTYLNGTSLDHHIRKTKGLPVAKVVDIFQSISDGLKVAHEAGLIHRDIKPSNVILTSEDVEEVKLVDFGIAKIVSGAPTQQLTQTGEIFGSPPYMSPEQCEGYELDERTDIYSLGCLIYEALTGHTPVSGSNLVEVLKAQVNEIPKTPSKIRPDLAETRDKGIRFKDVEYVVMRCLEKDKTDRYKSLDELLIDLHQIQSRRTIKKRKLSKRAAKEKAKNFVILMVVLSPIMILSAYYLNKGVQYFLDRGLIHASCMGRTWLADFGFHFNDRKRAKWFLESALSDVSKQADLEDKHHIRIGILCRLASIYKKDKNEKKYNKTLKELKNEIEEFEHPETKLHE